MRWLLAVVVAGFMGCAPWFPIEDPSPPEPDPDNPVTPIVLCHGFFGFDGFAGIDFLTYFYQVADDLRAQGEPYVFTPTVDPFNDSFVRGAQLVDRIAAIRAETGAERVILIGHSQGGLDARVAAHLEPDWVEAVVSYGTPHQGTPPADIAAGLLPDPRFNDLIDALTRLVAAPIYDAVGEETSVTAAFHQLSSAGAADFNAAIPDAPGVAYYSVTGRTDLRLARAACATADRPEFITRYDAVRDPLDPLFLIPEAIIDRPFAPTASDGLVPVASARHGRFLGCVPADHLDQIGQIFGDRPGLASTWHHKIFFRDLIAWLRTQGH
jgi:triacylglycerol lipase